MTRETIARYSAAMTPHLLSLVNRHDPHAAIDDPIALQFVPDMRELRILPEERADPIGDEANSPVEGIVHRYEDRVLLKLLTVCPIYCRFCFRRESVGAQKGGMLGPKALERALDYIRRRPEVWEVILTGGDPLALSPRRLSATIKALAAIQHVKVIRIHTRAPVADPAIVTNALCAALSVEDVSVYIALHANHPVEMTPSLQKACKKLRAHGVQLVSQTVLLKGVNDNPDILAALMRAFVEAGIKPYYLHHPDLAPGTGHFRLPLAQGLEIYENLSRKLSGLARPAYMLDIPGGYGKIPIPSSAIEPISPGVWRVRDPKGVQHVYREA